MFLPPGATLVAVFQTPLLPHIESVLQLLLCLLSETVHDPCLFLHLTSFCQIHLDLSLQPPCALRSEFLAVLSQNALASFVPKESLFIL